MVIQDVYTDKTWDTFVAVGANLQHIEYTPTMSVLVPVAGSLALPLPLPLDTAGVYCIISPNTRYVLYLKLIFMFYKQRVLAYF